MPESSSRSLKTLKNLTVVISVPMHLTLQQIAVAETLSLSDVVRRALRAEFARVRAAEAGTEARDDAA